MLRSRFLTCILLSLLSFALPSAHRHTHSLHRHRRSSPRPRVITYYPDWAPPKSMDYSLFDVIIFAFALPDQNYQLAWDTEQAPSLLSTVVSEAHATSTKVMLSVGGWTGSRYFSEAVATPQNRNTFANNILDAYNRFNLDGVDIDWEYPGQIGQQGNSESASDSDNMLLFFQLLQQKLPLDALISAAVQDTTFAGSDGHPMRDVSAFSHYVDWVTLMNYDNFATRQPPGPNAALSDGCSDSSQPTQNAVSGSESWTAAGFPPSKVVLGLPAYGYVIESDAQRLSERSPFRAYSEDGSGQIPFRSLIDQGILKQTPNGSFEASQGFTREWDRCSATPFLRSQSARQVISYDDPESLGIKTAWVRRMNLGGVNLFSVDGDTSQHHLTLSLHANLFPGTTPWASSVSSSSAVPPPSSSRVLPGPSASLSLLSSAASTLSQPRPASITMALPSGIVPDIFSHKS